MVKEIKSKKRKKYYPGDWPPATAAFSIEV
jgi:hypothetical protein